MANYDNVLVDVHEWVYCRMVSHLKRQSSKLGLETFKQLLSSYLATAVKFKTNWTHIFWENWNKVIMAVYGKSWLLCFMK